ncbi:hypothetical protein [uncultured Psychrobacter sp.]|uniref:hypothetical protein n=1 Tax=uncultured Psychrobacter sp. TaxID=259303 RepID=UPI0026261A4D|nr:hypothetical protein [uncultured Psychrobacter sp.]
MTQANYQIPNAKPQLTVCIINSSGNSGKTISGRCLVKPRLQDPKYYRIGFNNRNISGDEIFATVDKLRDLHVELMMDTSVIVEVEISEFERTIDRMNKMMGCHEDYDFFLVPVVDSSPKLIADSIGTIKILVNMGVPPHKIRILFNRDPGRHSAYDYFEELTDTLDELKIPYDLNAQFQCYDFYEKLEALNLSFEDLTEHNLIDAKAHLKKITEKGKIYRLTDAEKAAKAFYAQVVLVQRAALAYKSEHDEVFEILFQNYPESDIAENC